MPTNLNIGEIIGYLAGLAVLIKVYLYWRHSKVEEQQAEIEEQQVKPDIAKTYEDMALAQASRNDELRKELDARDKKFAEELEGLRCRIRNLEKELQAQLDKYELQEIFIDELLEGIKVLTQQLVEEAKLIPKWRPRRRTDKNTPPMTVDE